MITPILQWVKDNNDSLRYFFVVIFVLSIVLFFVFHFYKQQVFVYSGAVNSVEYRDYNTILRVPGERTIVLFGTHSIPGKNIIVIDYPNRLIFRKYQIQPIETPGGK